MRNFILTVFLVVLFCYPKVNAQSCNGHPRILGSTSQYDGWRNKANSSPFSEMKEQAIIDANTNTYQNTIHWGGSNQQYKFYCFRLKEILSACTMSYILDPSNRNFYVSKATQQMIDGLTYLIDNRPREEWEGNIPFGAALFESILTLDIMYCDINAQDITKIENMISPSVSTLKNEWPPSAPAVRGMWAIYEGDSNSVIAEKDLYKSQLLAQFSNDGVFLAGPDYADARMLEGDRYQKNFFMDILEMQGFNEFYSNSTLKKGHEWIFGYSSTPMGRLFGFGDSSLDRMVARDANDLGAYRASRFSQIAQEYANTKLGFPVPRANLLAYILIEENGYPVVSWQLPKSRIFNDGGAWFYENRQDKDILAAALWNPKSDATHQHKEVNAISLSGFNEILLTNAGYNGWDTGIENFSWSYIHDRAISANTALIDYPVNSPVSAGTNNNHVSKAGAGVEVGFTSDYLDYACGDSGNALPNGKHLRNFLFIHPSNGQEGYWVLVDEITGNSNSNQAHVALHPFSIISTAYEENESYTWTIQEYGSSPSYLTVNLGTYPSRVQRLNSIVAMGNFEHKRTKMLYSTYDFDSDKKRNIVSVLSPHKSILGRPQATRISGPDFSGTKITMSNGVTDFAIGSENANGYQTFDNHGFVAESVVYRTIFQTTEWYYVNHGTQFDNTSSNIGFSADNPITMIRKGNEAQIYNRNFTRVTLGTNNVSSDCLSLLVGGQSYDYIQSNNNSISFNLPAGYHRVQIVGSGNSNSPVGTSCNDGNPCTTGDQYDTGCNCIGFFQDADGDGICDAEDACPNDASNACQGVGQVNPLTNNNSNNNSNDNNTGSNSGNQNYCFSTGINSQYEYIQRVEIGGINNNSGPNFGYGDFTNISTTVTQGANVPISLVPGFAETLYNEHWKVWIDYNQDGVFDNQNEVAFSSNGTSAVSGTINIPSNASTGTTGMRVSMRWNAFPSPCTNVSYGEVEDYTININQGFNNGNIAFRQVAPEPSLLIYPNPVEDILNVELQHTSGEGQIEIYDNIGRLIQTNNFTNTEIKLPIRDLNSGIYMLIVRFKGEQPLTTRFVKKKP